MDYSWKCTLFPLRFTKISAPSLAGSAYLLVNCKGNRRPAAAKMGLALEIMFDYDLIRSMILFF